MKPTRFHRMFFEKWRYNILKCLSCSQLKPNLWDCPLNYRYIKFKIRIPKKLTISDSISHVDRAGTRRSVAADVTIVSAAAYISLVRRGGREIGTTETRLVWNDVSLDHFW